MSKKQLATSKPKEIDKDANTSVEMTAPKKKTGFVWHGVVIAKIVLCLLVFCSLSVPCKSSELLCQEFISNATDHKCKDPFYGAINVASHDIQINYRSCSGLQCGHMKVANGAIALTTVGYQSGEAVLADPRVSEAISEDIGFPGKEHLCMLDHHRSDIEDEIYGKVKVDEYYEFATRGTSTTSIVLPSAFYQYNKVVLRLDTDVLINDLLGLIEAHFPCSKPIEKVDIDIDSRTGWWKQTHHHCHVFGTIMHGLMNNGSCLDAHYLKNPQSFKSVLEGSGFGYVDTSVPSSTSAVWTANSTYTVSVNYNNCQAVKIIYETYEFVVINCINPSKVDKGFYVQDCKISANESSCEIANAVSTAKAYYAGSIATSGFYDVFMDPSKVIMSYSIVNTKHVSVLQNNILSTLEKFPTLINYTVVNHTLVSSHIPILLCNKTHNGRTPYYYLTSSDGHITPFGFYSTLITRDSRRTVADALIQDEIMNQQVLVSNSFTNMLTLQSLSSKSVADMFSVMSSSVHLIEHQQSESLKQFIELSGMEDQVRDTRISVLECLTEYQNAKSLSQERSVEPPFYLRINKTTLFCPVQQSKVVPAGATLIKIVGKYKLYVYGKTELSQYDEVVQTYKEVKSLKAASKQTEAKLRRNDEAISAINQKQQMDATNLAHSIDSNLNFTMAQSQNTSAMLTQIAITNGEHEEQIQKANEKGFSLSSSLGSLRLGFVLFSTLLPMIIIIAVVLYCFGPSLLNCIRSRRPKKQVGLEKVIVAPFTVEHKEFIPEKEQVLYGAFDDAAKKLLRMMKGQKKPKGDPRNGDLKLNENYMDDLTYFGCFSNDLNGSCLSKYHPTPHFNTSEPRTYMSKSYEYTSRCGILSGYTSKCTTIVVNPVTYCNHMPINVLLAIVSTEDELAAPLPNLHTLGVSPVFSRTMGYNRFLIPKANELMHNTLYKIKRGPNYLVTDELLACLPSLHKCHKLIKAANIKVKGSDLLSCPMVVFKYDVDHSWVMVSSRLYVLVRHIHNEQKGDRLFTVVGFSLGIANPVLDNKNAMFCLSCRLAVQQCFSYLFPDESLTSPADQFNDDILLFCLMMLSDVLLDQSVCKDPILTLCSILPSLGFFAKDGKPLEFVKKEATICQGLLNFSSSLEGESFYFNEYSHISDLGNKFFFDLDLLNAMTSFDSVDPRNNQFKMCEINHTHESLEAHINICGAYKELFSTSLGSCFNNLSRRSFSLTMNGDQKEAWVNDLCLDMQKTQRIDNIRRMSAIYEIPD